MFARVLLVFVMLLCVIALVGCEGDTGPAGPAGPAGSQGAAGEDGLPGPAVILAFGHLDGDVDPVTVLSFWPADVTVTVADIGTGLWDVTLTGTFPSTQGTVLGSNSDSSIDTALTAIIQSWSSTEIVFRVGAWSILGSAREDIEFSFVVLGE